MQLVTVATFDSELPAKNLVRTLQQAGISAHVEDHRRVQRYWFLSRPYAGFQVTVPSEDFNKSNEVIKHSDMEDGILREAVRCPDCGSSRVEYPQTTRKFLLPTLLFHFLRMIGVAEHNYYCQQCHYTWTRSSRQKKEARKPITAKLTPRRSSSV